MTAKRKRDAYDRAVRRLKKEYEEDNEAIYDSWSGVQILFGFVSADRNIGWDRGIKCGCLTQIRGYEFCAETKDLTDAIRADDRLPGDANEIRPHHLPFFAEWQRRIDKTLGRTPPR